MIYILQQKNKALSLLKNEKHYVIGFKNVIHARSVHYNLHPEPKLEIINEYDKREFTYISGDVRLQIPKCHGDILSPMNDGNFHMREYPNEEFIKWPFYKQLGVLLPYSLEEESPDHFVFRTIMIDPMPIPMSEMPRKFDTDL
jgi:hypothetical protein